MGATLPVFQARYNSFMAASVLGNEPRVLTPLCKLMFSDSTAWCKFTLRMPGWVGEKQSQVITREYRAVRRNTGAPRVA